MEERSGIRRVRTDSWSCVCLQCSRCLCVCITALILYCTYLSILKCCRCERFVCVPLCETRGETAHQACTQAPLRFEPSPWPGFCCWLIFSDRVSCIQTQCVAEDDLEFLNLLFLLPRCWGTGLCCAMLLWCWDESQDFVHARQALYRRSYTPHPHFMYLKTKMCLLLGAGEMAQWFQCVLLFQRIWVQILAPTLAYGYLEL